MDRRMQGVLVLILVLFGAVVVPSLAPKAIAGSATLGRIPPAPRVGTCLLQDPPDLATAVQRQLVYHLGSCVTAHFGEVALVVENASGVVQGSGLSSLKKDPCADQSAYLGWTPPTTIVAGLRWRPINVPVINMVPGTLQRNFGQKWVACVVTPSTSGTSYVGSVKDALHTGKLPAAFAACQFELALNHVGLVNCSQPHRFETFAYAQLSGGFHDPQVLASDCLKIAQLSTSRSDPSFGGALTIGTTAFHFDAAGHQQPGLGDAADDSEAVCAAQVTGARLLSRSLFGIGDQALPLS